MAVLSQTEALGYPVDVYYPHAVSHYDAAQSRQRSGPYVLTTPHYELNGDPSSGVLLQVNRKQDGRGEALLAPTGMHIDAVASSTVMSTASAGESAARVRVGRNGPLYSELTIRDVPVVSGAAAPVLMADAILHCYSEKMHAVVTVRATEDISLDRVLIRLPFVKDSVRYLAGESSRLGAGTSASVRGPAGYVLENAGKAAVCALTVPAVDYPKALSLEVDSDGSTQLALTMTSEKTRWKAGESRRMCFALLFPMDGGDCLRARVQDEVHPDVRIRAASRDIPAVVSRGYQADKGFYLLHDPASRPGSYHGIYPGSIPSCQFTIESPSRAREVYICLTREAKSAQLSGLPVVTDASGLPTGDEVQLSRKWESPPYSEAYVRLAVGSDETRVIGLREPKTWWGEFPAVQMSGLDLTEYFDWGSPWWECSMGESEFICYEFHRADIASIADFRPIDGPKLDKEHLETAWFRNAGGAEFLKYQSEGVWQTLHAKHTRFVSNGPSFVDATVSMFSVDGKATAQVEIVQPPCRDYNRVFYRLRYDLQGGIPLDNLRLFALGDEDYPVEHKPRSFGYLAAGGEVVADRSAWDGRPVRLHQKSPFAFIEGDPQGCKGALIRSVRGRIGGVALSNVMLRPISAERGLQRQLLAVVPETAASKTRSGDYAELEIELVGWGGDYTPSWQPMLAEREAYAPERFRCQVLDGQMVSDFPVRVRPDPGMECVELVLSGGSDAVPLFVEGMPSTRAPVIYELLGAEWARLDRERSGNDSWQAVKQNGLCTFATALSTGGAARRLLIGPAGLKPPAAPKSAKRLESTIVASRVPHVVFARQKSSLRWSVKNTGTAAWKAGDVLLQVEGFFGHETLLARTSVPVVPPGDTAMFIARASPEWLGAENEISKVIKARVIGSDGTSLSNEWIDWIRLLNWPDGAEFVSDTIPATMRAGEQRTVELSFRNVGFGEWSGEARHCLEVVGAFDETSRFCYPTDSERVAPGEVWTARIPLEAPAKPGRYRTRWMMGHRDVAWFGPLVERTVRVTR